MSTLVSRGAGIFIAGLVLASSACAYGLGTAAESKRPNEPGGAVQLYVTNSSGGPMEVYAAGSGILYRVGTVHPGLAGRFVVRPAMIGNGTVEFVARSGNGPLLRSGRILVAPGDVVDFQLTPSPVTSTATIRPRLHGQGPGKIEA
jgi:hypothetical protein